MTAARFVEIREAYGNDLQMGWIVTINGFQVGGDIDRSGAGDREFETLKEAEKFAKLLREI